MEGENPILLVEDSHTQALHLVGVLEQAGWSVHHASSAEQAMAFLREGTPQLILIDYYLPGMRGDELCRQVRMRVETRVVPIVLLTGDAAQELELRGLESGADDFIAKSVDTSVLLVRLQALCAKARRMPSSGMIADSIFQNARLLAVDDSPTYLTYLVEQLRAESYHIETASDGHEAIERLSREDFDCVLVDFIMPEMDGIEVCRQIQNFCVPRGKSVMVLMLTSKEDNQSLAQALEAGADDFVGKSSDIIVIKGRIRALLRRKFYEEEHRRRLSAELRTRELESEHDRLHKETAEAQAATKARSDFLAAMSHELRTPLNGVIGMVTLLMQTDLNQEQQRFVRLAKSSGDALLALINDILDFTKIDAGKLELETADFDLRDIVENVAGILACKAHEKNLELITRIHPNVPTHVRGDAARIQQILTNLVNNAVKFTAQGEVTILVRCDSPQDGVVMIRISVIDTGIGIADDVRHRLFQTFSQVDASTTRKYGGTGLGLAISKRLVEAMGGHIGMAARTSGGSEFWFSIPFALQAKQPTTYELPRPLCGGRVLIVDNNAASRQMLREELSDIGLDVDDAGDCSAALTALEDSAAKQRAYDIVLIDERMIEDRMFAAEIDDASGVGKAHLILLTRLGARTDPAIQHGSFSALLPKPVKQSELFSAINKVAAGGDALLPEAVVMGAAPGAPQKAPARKVRVLLAEDNEINQLVATKYLILAGYECDVVGTGTAAVQAVQQKEYDLVLMDCQMPEMDGFEATRRIRALERKAGMKRNRLVIIACTANAVRGDEERCLDVGMDDYLSKPINQSQLLGKIDHHLDRAKSGPSIETSPSLAHALS